MFRSLRISVSILFEKLFSHCIIPSFLIRKSRTTRFSRNFQQCSSFRKKPIKRENDIHFQPEHQSPRTIGVTKVAQIPVRSKWKRADCSIGARTCVVSETGARVREKKSRVSRRVCTPTLDTLGQRLFKSSWEIARGAFAPPNDRASNASNTLCTNEPTGRLLYLAPWLKTPRFVLRACKLIRSFCPSPFFTLRSCSVPSDRARLQNR